MTFPIPQPPVDLPQTIYTPLQVVDGAAEPSEGRRNIPFVINWGVNIPVTRSARFNSELGNSAGGNIQFSAIRTIYVDNTSCGAVVTVAFPNSGFEIQAPPYSSGYYPVVANTREFYAFSLGAQNGDRTFFNVLNYDVPPIVSYTFEQAQIAIVAGLAIPAGAGGTAVATPVAAGRIGVLRTAQIALIGYGNGAAAGSIVVQLMDAAGAIQYAYGAAVTPANGFITNQTIIDLQNVDIKFTNGLSIRTLNNTTNTGVAIVTANLYFNQG